MMSDTYQTIAEIAANQETRLRLAACAAQQGVAGDPEVWVWERRYQIAAAPGWAAAVDYWRAANPGADPGGWATADGVITDGMILAHLQPMVTRADTRPDPPAAA